MNIIEETINEIKKSTDYQTNKKILKEKVKADLHITHNGGLFYITIELISFLSMLSDDTVILEDVYENPIMVSRKVLLENALDTYRSTTEMWFTQHEQLKRIRTI